MNMCIDSTIHVFIHLNIHRLNANSSIAISNTEQGTKFTRVNNHRLRNFAESRRVFQVNSCYPGLIMIVLMAQRSARRDWRSGGPRFKSHPRLTSQSWPSYQLNQLGSKAASDSTLKQLTTCGVSNTCTFTLSHLFCTPTTRPQN